jgi:phage protein D
MENENLRIAFGPTGAEITELYPDLTVLEVELDDQLAGMFRMTLDLPPRADGHWPYVDDERLAPWTRVVISLDFGDDVVELIVGYITHLRLHFDLGIEHSRLEIWGLDATVLMDREDTLLAWPNKKDSDIAAEIFAQHHLTPRVTPTKVVHQESVSTIIQRETDMQLLKRLALRNGFECFVEGDIGFFRPPAVAEGPQPVLSVHFGDETTINRFTVEVNMLTPAGVTLSQVDPVTGAVVTSAVQTPAQPALGARPAADFLPDAVDPGLLRVASTVATGAAELAEICRSAYDQREWFVTGEGEVAANDYGAVLRPRGTVTLKGIGETYSGVYYVTHVTHQFVEDSYTQQFRVKRNALMPTGAEDFSAGGTAAADAVASAAGALAVGLL